MWGNLNGKPTITLKYDLFKSVPIQTSHPETNAYTTNLAKSIPSIDQHKMLADKNGVFGFIVLDPAKEHDSYTSQFLINFFAVVMFDSKYLKLK